MDSTTDEAFEALLRYMRDSRGFDFTGYKRTVLMRRVRHRMDQAGIRLVRAITSTVLQASSDEFAALFNTILINVTAFFRDPEAWECDREPRSSRGCWPASGRATRSGCGAPAAPPGEEAYTLAMLLAEALGTDAFRRAGQDLRHRRRRGRALTEARRRPTTPRRSRRSPPDLLARYFEQVNGRYVFHKDLRRAVIFGRNDLVQDAPISRVDLLVCRNTLMYLNAETQPDLWDASTSRSPQRRPVPRARRDAAEPQRPVHPARPEATGSSRKAAGSHCGGRADDAGRSRQRPPRRAGRA